MKFTLNWLRDHLDTSCSLDEICKGLVSLGHEVEEVLILLRIYLISELLKLEM